MDRIAPENPLDLATLADDIAACGIDSVAASRLEAVVRAARRAGANPTLTELVVDQAAPAVARERAFGRLALALAAERPTPRPRAAA